MAAETRKTLITGLIYFSLLLSVLALASAKDEYHAKIEAWRAEQEARAPEGSRWYPVRQVYRITGQFSPYEQPREVAMLNARGEVEKRVSPGVISFQWNGEEHQLEPVLAGHGKFFIVFRDLTGGKTTPPGGRYLYADLPRDGEVTLDFNQATNPPCAFTADANCPPPPPENHLQVAVEAGEQTSHPVAAGAIAAAR